MSTLQNQTPNAQKETDKKALKLFLLILIPASLLLEALYIYTSIDPLVLILLLMWVPGITGIITAKTYYKKEKILGLRLCSPRYFLWVIAIPFLYLSLSYLAAWAILGDSTAGFSEILKNISNLPVFLGPILIGIFASSGEEIGWRGFLYPILERLNGRTKAILYSGLLWGVWHFPLMISGHYLEGTPLIYTLLTFTVEVLFLTILFSWSRGVSGSVLPAILFHTVHNFFNQNVFQPLSTKPGVPYLAGEQGVITILFTGLLCLVVLWQWRQQEAHAQLEANLKTD